MGGDGWTRPARARRPLRTGLVLGGLTMALCLVGVAGLGTWNVQVVTGASGPVRDTADGFFREVAAGDVDQAYQRLCAQARSRWSEVGFAGWVRTPPLVSGYEIVDVSVRTKAGRPVGEVTVRVTRDGGAAEERRLPVVKEDGEWRVCGDPY
ncbi:Rv0361 family membrane protein [Micromonospora psammae]|uniref:Rv0361 family membrane protein n=1 Tax=Micromonospora sp. CPCC 205556 TaxID=3122398 RepID=UPI002FEF887B